MRLYANQATGTVAYDFVLICKGVWTFPNVETLRFKPTPRYVNMEFPSRITDVTQNLGSKSAAVEVSCDFDVGTWTRTGDVANGQVFMDIAHNSVTEPWQWLSTTGDLASRVSMKVTLDEPVFQYNGEKWQVDLLFREYSRSSKSNETYVERFGLNL